MEVFDIYSRFKIWHVVVTVVFFVSMLFAIIAANVDKELFNSVYAIPLIIIVAGSGVTPGLSYYFVPESAYIKTGELKISDNELIVNNKEIEFGQIANIVFTVRFNRGIGLNNRVKITTVLLDTYQYKYVIKSRRQIGKLELICAEWRANDINVVLKKGLF